MRIVFRVVLFAGAFVSVVAISLAIQRWNRPVNKFRRAIVVDHSYYSSDDFSGDYMHLVRGHMKTTPLSELAQLLDLRLSTTKSIHETIPNAHGWQLFGDIDWWQVPEKFDEVYYDVGSDSECYLGRRGNEIYLQDLQW